MTLPVTKLVMPSDLAGQSNGRLPEGLLIAPGYPLRPKARMHRRAAVAEERDQPLTLGAL